MQIADWKTEEIVLLLKECRRFQYSDWISISETLAAFIGPKYSPEACEDKFKQLIDLADYPDVQHEGIPLQLEFEFSYRHLQETIPSLLVNSAISRTIEKYLRYMKEHDFSAFNQSEIAFIRRYLRALSEDDMLGEHMSLPPIDPEAMIDACFKANCILTAASSPHLDLDDICCYELTPAWNSNPKMPTIEYVLRLLCEYSPDDEERDPTKRFARFFPPELVDAMAMNTLSHLLSIPCAGPPFFVLTKRMQPTVERVQQDKLIPPTCDNHNISQQRICELSHFDQNENDLCAKSNGIEMDTNFVPHVTSSTVSSSSEELAFSPATVEPPPPPPPPIVSQLDDTQPPLLESEEVLSQLGSPQIVLPPPTLECCEAIRMTPPINNNNILEERSTNPSSKSSVTSAMSAMEEFENDITIYVNPRSTSEDVTVTFIEENDAETSAMDVESMPQLSSQSGPPSLVDEGDYALCETVSIDETLKTKLPEAHEDMEKTIPGEVRPMPDLYQFDTVEISQIPIISEHEDTATVESVPVANEDLELLEEKKEECEQVYESPEVEEENPDEDTSEGAAASVVVVRMAEEQELPEVTEETPQPLEIQQEQETAAMIEVSIQPLESPQDVTVLSNEISVSSPPQQQLPIPQEIMETPTSIPEVQEIPEVVEDTQQPSPDLVEEETPTSIPEVQEIPEVVEDTQQPSPDLVEEETVAQVVEDAQQLLPSEIHVSIIPEELELEMANGTEATQQVQDESPVVSSMPEEQENVENHALSEVGVPTLHNSSPLEHGQREGDDSLLLEEMENEIVNMKQGRKRRNTSESLDASPPQKRKLHHVDAEVSINTSAGLEEHTQEVELMELSTLLNQSTGGEIFAEPSSTLAVDSVTETVLEIGPPDQEIETVSVLSSHVNDEPLPVKEVDFLEPMKPDLSTSSRRASRKSSSKRSSLTVEDADSEDDEEEKLRLWKKKLMMAFRNAFEMKDTYMFDYPIEEESYTSVVKCGADLHTVLSMIDQDEIRDVDTFLKEYSLIFANACMFNKSNSDVHNAAIAMYKESMTFFASLHEEHVPPSRGRRSCTEVQKKQESNFYLPKRKS